MMRKIKKENNSVSSDTQKLSVRRNVRTAFALASVSLALVVAIMGSVLSFAKSVPDSEADGDSYKTESAPSQKYVSEENSQKIEEFSQTLAELDAKVSALDSEIEEYKLSGIPEKNIYVKELYDRKTNILLEKIRLCGEYSVTCVSWAEETRVLLSEPISEYEKYNEIYKERLSVVYEEGFPDLSEVFNTSSTVMDLVMGKVMLDEVRRYDEELCEKVSELYAVVEDGLGAVKYYLAESENYEELQSNTEKEFLSCAQEASEYLKKVCEDKDTYNYFLQYSAEQDQKFVAFLEQAVSQSESAGRAPELDFPLGEEYFYTDYIGHGHENRYEFSPALGKYVNIFHSGVDINTSRQYASVKAAADGTVIFADYCPIRGYTVAILHTGGIVTVYSGCSTLNAELGNSVSTGNVIALTGMTGDAENFKVTFEVFDNDDFVDPAVYIAMPDVSLSGNQK